MAHLTKYDTKTGSAFASNTLTFAAQNGEEKAIRSRASRR